MFQACEVKMTKIDAVSSPNWLPGNRLMKMVSATGKKTRIGIDWSMSRIGTRTFWARCSLAAAVPYTKVKTVESPSAMNMRVKERAA